MSQLKIPCSAQPDTDYVLVKPETWTSEGRDVVELACVQAGDSAANDMPLFDEAAVHLDDEQARQLLNWLGVWLHGGNRT